TPFGARVEPSWGAVAQTFATPNPYTGVQIVDVGQPGARALTLHLSEVDLAACDAILISDWATNAIVGEVDPASKGDVTVGPLASDKVRLTLTAKGCATARGFKLVDIAPEQGGFDATALTL